MIVTSLTKSLSAAVAGRPVLSQVQLCSMMSLWMFVTDFVWSSAI